MLLQRTVLLVVLHELPPAFYKSSIPPNFNPYNWPIPGYRVPVPISIANKPCTHCPSCRKRTDKFASTIGWPRTKCPLRASRWSNWSDNIITINVHRSAPRGERAGPAYSRPTKYWPSPSKFINNKLHNQCRNRIWERPWRGVNTRKNNSSNNNLRMKKK